MGDLSRDLAIEGGDGRWRGVVSPDWVVWTPNGGFLAALALRAAGVASALPRPVSISCHYLNVPALDIVELEVSPLRVSKRAESLRVRMIQGETPILEALVWTAADGLDGLGHAMGAMPAVPPPEEMAPWTPREGAPPPDGVLPLWWNIDARMEGWPDGHRWEDRLKGDPVRREWIRYRPRATFDDPFLDAARPLIAIDTLMFPAAMMTHPEPIAFFAPSLDLSVWFHQPAHEDEWLLCESDSPVGDGGLVNGSARVWTRDGRLVASGGQQMLCRPIPGAVPERARDTVGSAS